MVRHTGEDFIDEEGVAVTTMLSLESACINGTELDAPQADRLPCDDDAPLGQEILDITVTQIESVVEPYSIWNDIGWETVAFVGIHPPILPISAR